MAVKLLDRPISSPSRASIISLSFGAARFYRQQRGIARRKIFMSSIKRCSEALRGLLSLNQLTVELVGARRLPLVIIQSGLVFLIRRSMFQQMAGRLASLFTISEIIQDLMFWLIFTWHNPLMAVLTGNPIFGSLLSQLTHRWRHLRRKVTCSAIILV